MKVQTARLKEIEKGILKLSEGDEGVMIVPFKVWGELQNAYGASHLFRSANKQVAFIFITKKDGE